jgi:hypothetical protein
VINPASNTTFEIATDEHGKFIRCLVCKRRSYNPNDIEHRYCGSCHQYHPITCNADPS